MFPETDQLTCQTTSSKVETVFGVHVVEPDAEPPSFVQMMTRRS